MAGKFEIFSDKGGEYRFRLKASNGQVVLSSESYKSKASAIKGAESVQSNGGDEANFERSTTSGEKFRFVLKAANRQVIGTSQSYASEAARDQGIASVGLAAKGAPIVEVDS